MTASEQRQVALENANVKRIQRAEIRRQLRTGRTPALVRVLREQPESLHGAPLIEVVRLSYSASATRQRALAKLNEAAVRDGVNLMFQLGDPRATRAREWLMTTGVRHMQYRQPAKEAA